MHFGDPHDGHVSDLEWSLDWRFEQMLQKLKKYDLQVFAQMVALQQFGDPDIGNLTTEKKRVLIDCCRNAIVAAMIRD
ncbi:MAG: hypothetical protein HPM95_18875 [Alphaproteobacteria bacterium]|nr:hypothetical protein [Alphaproteobacteria bacterium]